MLAESHVAHFPKLVVGLRTSAVALAGAGFLFLGLCRSEAAGIDELAGRLRADVSTLALEIGPRHVKLGESLRLAEAWITEQFETSDYAVTREVYDALGDEVANLIAVRQGTGGRAEEIVLIGAHYDTTLTTPGADDNASGVAVMLALARHFATAKTARTLRFVAFAQEEPVYFQTEWMGSRVHARNCRDRGDNIVAMLSLETMGYFSQARKSQHYPPIVGWFYLSRGNFIAIIGDRSSKELVRTATRSFRIHSDFPAQAAAMPRSLPGIGWSDHWSFWQEGYSAIMITDTALFRNPHYHQRTDTVDTLDYESLARVAIGLQGVVNDLANPAEITSKKKKR